MALTKVQKLLVKMCNSPRRSSHLISQFNARTVNVLEELSFLKREGYIDGIGDMYLTRAEHRDFENVLTVKQSAEKKATCTCEASGCSKSNCPDCSCKEAMEGEPCMTCNGQGTYGDGQTCPDCDGSGKEAMGDYMAMSDAEVPCDRCGGEGYVVTDDGDIVDSKCPDCFGTGKVKKEDHVDYFNLEDKTADDDEEEDEEVLDIEEEVEYDDEDEDDETDPSVFVSQLIEDLFAGETKLDNMHEAVHEEFGEGEEGEEAFVLLLEMLQEELEVRNVLSQEPTRQLDDSGDFLDLGLEEYEAPEGLGASVKKSKASLNAGEAIACEGCNGQGFIVLEVTNDYPEDQQEPCGDCAGKGFQEFPQPKANKKGNKRRKAMMEVTKFEDYDLDDREHKDAYDQWLDDVYGDQGELVAQYGASRILEEVDPTAYRVGFSDWIESEMDSNPKWECPICDELFDSEGEAEDHMEDEGLEIANEMIPTGATKSDIVSATGLDESDVEDLLEEYHSQKTETEDEEDTYGTEEDIEDIEEVEAEPETDVTEE